MLKEVIQRIFLSLNLLLSVNFANKNTAHCQRSQSLWCRRILVALAQVGQGTPGPSDAVLVPSEQKLYESWGEAEGGGVAQGHVQCHAFVGPDSARPDQPHSCMDPNNSSYQA